MLDVFLEALLDTLKLAPVLLIVHIIIEVIEVFGATDKLQKTLSGGFAPLLGTAVGIIPQCGFSVVAAELYSRRKISLGALVAIFLATTDEALPIMLSSIDGLSKVWKLIIVVFIASLLGGYCVYLCEKIYKRLKPTAAVALTVSADAATLTSAAGEEKESEISHEHDHADEAEEVRVAVGCHHHNIHRDEEGGTEKYKNKFVRFFMTYLKHPIIHTLTVLLYCFIVNMVFGTILFYVGEDAVSEFLASTGYFQPLIAGVVGLIPNCAASVAVTQLFVSGGLNLGGAVAGLCCGAGIGFAVLIKENRPVWQTAAIIIGVYVYAVSVGLIVTAIGF